MIWELKLHGYYEDGNTGEDHDTSYYGSKADAMAAVKAQPVTYKKGTPYDVPFGADWKAYELTSRKTPTTKAEWVAAMNQFKVY